ncbi:uncharacterized protein LOC112460731 [Temnothorax curvispinosus]|uniref:Uncharacterized protein LOC112460731 n=1 Tax=Temnothorax curvispinosus TaxID=300111 RepID=A0A6J1QL82_9HYME|nr:uncharacterized protein LOC112460731 [Temnothorax curvispinosus]
MADILSIGGEPIFDERIVGIETHMYNPYVNTTFGHNDEIRITIQQQDLYTLPCDSFLTIKNVSLTAERARRAHPVNSTFTPLNIFLGFCEDYKRVVINTRYKLILIRSRSDHNCVVDPKKIVPRDPAKDPKITLLKVQWRMPHVALNDVTKLLLLRTLESGRFLSAGFRSWDLPDGETNLRFDHCALANVKLYLNSEFYPYDDVNADFESDKFAVLYEMYAKFRGAYYGDSRDDALFSPREFARVAPLVVIDCSRQNEAVKSATVDVRIEFKCKENVPPKTTAFCLIVHDRVIEVH